MKRSHKKLWTSLMCAGVILLGCGVAMSQLQPFQFKKHSVKAYQHEFSQLAFVPGSRQIATLGMDADSVKVLKLWDYTNPNKISAVKTTGLRPLSSGQDMAFNATKKLMAVVWEPDNIAGQVYRTIEVYQLPERKKVHRMVIHLNRAETLAREKIAFSSDGNHLFFAAFSVRMWNTRDWKLTATLRGDETEKVTAKREIIDFAISPDSTRIATLTQGSQVRLWDGKTGRALPQGQQPKALIAPEHYFEPTTLNDSSLKFAPGGHSLFVLVNIITPRAAIFDRSKYEWAGVAFYKWDVAKHKLDGVKLLKEFTFQAAEFDPQGKYLVMSGYHELSEVSLWDLDSLTRIQTLVKGEGAYYDVAISPDGKSIAAAQDRGGLFLWQRGNGKFE